MGHRWQLGSRRAPTVYNAVFTWPSSGMGARRILRRRPHALVQASVEINATLDHVLSSLKSMTDYVVMFSKGFSQRCGTSYV
ncbi:cytochrome c peroxidase [Bradyrhizobium sp. DASA03007]|uniref:cytochrome c peroxidase n=1 Tax=unclassified Bradyrhizobium TaxID=2631580 RepID=UPI003F7032D8